MRQETQAESEMEQDAKMVLMTGVEETKNQIHENAPEIECVIQASIGLSHSLRCYFPCPMSSMDHYRSLGPQFVADRFP